jgi:hypothetical protein
MFDKGTENSSKTYRDLRDRVSEAKKEMDDAATVANNLNRELKNMVVVEDLDNDIKEAEQALKDAQDAAEKLKKNLDSVKATEFTKAFDEAKKKLEGLTGIDLSEIGNIDDLNTLLKRFVNEGITGVRQGLEEAGIQVKQLGEENSKTGEKVKGLTKDFVDQNRAAADIKGFKERILQFFSL